MLIDKNRRPERNETEETNSKSSNGWEKIIKLWIGQLKHHLRDYFSKQFFQLSILISVIEVNWNLKFISLENESCGHTWSGHAVHNIQFIVCILQLTCHVMTTCALLSQRIRTEVMWCVYASCIHDLPILFHTFYAHRTQHTHRHSIGIFVM